MADPTQASRSDLVMAWRGWVVENLGPDAEPASAAAAAAADVAAHGGSFADAVDAATKTFDQVRRGGVREKAGGNVAGSTSRSLLAIAALAAGAALWIAPWELSGSTYCSNRAPFWLWLASAGACIGAALLSSRRWTSLTVIAVILAIAAVLWLPVGLLLSHCNSFI